MNDNVATGVPVVSDVKLGDADRGTFRRQALMHTIPWTSALQAAARGARGSGRGGNDVRHIGLRQDDPQTSSFYSRDQIAVFFHDKLSGRGAVCVTSCHQHSMAVLGMAIFVLPPKKVGTVFSVVT